MSPSLIKWDRVGFPIKALNDHRVRKSKKSCLTGPDLDGEGEEVLAPAAQPLAHDGHLVPALVRLLPVQGLGQTETRHPPGGGESDGGLGGVLQGQQDVLPDTACNTQHCTDCSDTPGISDIN